MRSLGYRLSAVLLVAVGVAHLLYHRGYTLDDAYISFRYARNLARGVGLVYNPGDYVKGYSNTLYTLLMVVPEWFGSNSIGVSRTLGVLAFCAMCFLGYHWYAGDPRPAVRDRALWLLSLLGVSTSVAIHCITGLETGLHALLVLAGVMMRLREQREDGKPWSALLFAAVVLSRPEGVLLFAAMAAQDVVFRVVRRRLRLWDVVWYAVPLLTFAGELGLSHLYYGAALPQTYFAKTSGATSGSGVLKVLSGALPKQFASGSYLARGLRTMGWGLPALGVALLALGARERRMQNLAFVAVVLAQIVFIAMAGRDWAPAFRFGMPLLPLLFVLVVEAIGFIAQAGRGYARALGWLLAAGVVGVAVPVNVQASRDAQAKKYVDGGGLMIEGEMLRKLADSGATLASYDIGGQGYAAGGFDILDGAGLTVRQTAKCRDRVTPRCKRAASLMAPEIVRRHPSRTKDAYIAAGARATGPYLELEGARYLIKRGLVLVEQPAEGTAPPESEGAAPAGLKLAAHDLAPALRAGQETSVTLYWRRASESAPPLQSRQLIWEHSSGHRQDAQASSVLWSMTGLDAWSPDALFADFAVLHAPSEPGRHVLRAIAADGQAFVVGSADIVAGSAAAARARQMTAEAQQKLAAGDEAQAQTLLRRATQLDPGGPGVAIYQRVVSDRARRARQAAEAVAAENPRGALGKLRAARLQLHRAYWDSQRALPVLRREIDDNAAMRRTLMDRENPPG